MTLTDMSPARIFKEPYGQINSIAFHRTADFLVAGHDAGMLTVYSTFEGKKLGTIDCSKFGVAHVQYTHHSKAVIHASTKDSSSEPLSRHAIRYLSHHDGKYLRFFHGHTGPVNSLSMSPKTDQFMSTSVDRTLLIWDLRTAGAQAKMEAPGCPCAAMDEEGLVFAVGVGGGVVGMFDARDFGHGPFLAMPLPLQKYGLPESVPISGIKFSSNQQHLMVVVANTVMIMDTFSGKEVVAWQTGPGQPPLPMEASFSIDGKYVLSGTSEKTIKVWEVPPGGSDDPPEQRRAYISPRAVWMQHPAVPACAQWAPTRQIAATACHALMLWVPSGPGVAAAS